MAAGDFSPSVLLEAQIKLDQMFASPNVAMTELRIGSAETARAVLARQRSRTVPRLTGDKCIGVEAYFIRPHAENGQDFATPTTCATPCGDEAETVKGEYETVVLAEAQAKLQDNRCNNFMEFAEEMAVQQAHVMAQLRYEFNRFIVIPTIAAASQANLDTFMDATWDGTTNTPRIVVDEAEFTWENFNEFNIVAANNNFGDFFWVTGRLFNSNKWEAMLNEGNEGFRNQARAYAEQEIFFDVRDLDQTMTRKTAFAIDQNSYAYWNTYRNTPTPTQVAVADGEKWVWIQADPILRWNNNGRLSPVFYEFEMAKTCSGRDSQKFLQNQYCIYARHLGGFEFVPTGPNGEKGALQFAIS